MKTINLSNTSFALFTCLLFSSAVIAEDKSINSETVERVIVVTAEFDETNVLDLPSSVTVIDADVIERNNAQHFSDLLNLAPNVNFATGASRGRFVQIRGIGERSEFSEPVNYSVGVVVDGIDLTGIATAATMLDIQQVEILRGPQGTLNGANGLAGLINIVSNAPSDSFYSRYSFGLENYNGRSVSAVVSDSPSETIGYRFALGQYQSDGYMKNVFLDRKDTNNLNEASVRGKVVYQPVTDFKLTTNLFFVDIDNGYDAFSLDSNRNTYSDQPGHDRQQTRAISLIGDWTLSQTFRLETILSSTNSDLKYGYDEDWSNEQLCIGLPCEGWTYSSFDNFTRDNVSKSIDGRLHYQSIDNVTNWTVGYYVKRQEVDLIHQYTYLTQDFTSSFDTKNSAVYGQLKNSIAANWVLTTGLRFERRTADYQDNEAEQFHPTENMWGGKIALENHYAKNRMLYLVASRGYKAGGFNASAVIPVAKRPYDAELLWNYEAGIKGSWLDDKLVLQTSIFYQDRGDMQSKQSLILSNANGEIYSDTNPCPCSFNDYLINADGGESYGLEVEVRWQSSDKVELYSSLGLLKTAFRDYQSYTHDLVDQDAIIPTPYDMDGRGFAHSPEYQLVFGSNFFVDDHWTLNAQIEAKDSFYFSDRHNVKSEAYEILNWGLNYQQDDWEINFFIRNITNEKIQTRGFGSFANDPRDFYEVKGPYYQFAAPRTYGISASIVFE